LGVQAKLIRETKKETIRQAMSGRRAFVGLIWMLNSPQI